MNPAINFSSLSWKKMGLIFRPGMHDWMHTHAQNPMTEHLGEGVYRVHISCRDKQNRAHGGSFDFSIKTPQNVLRVSSQPTLGLGALGCFDDSGVMPSSLVRVGTSTYLYYTGWSKTVDVPFSFHIGLAISKDGESFTRYSQAPVLGRNHFDPYITGAPFVLKEGDIYKMWYISGTKWTQDHEQHKPRHFYTVKYAESRDGVSWQTSDKLCLDYQEEEYAIARPIVFKEPGGYGMWFTTRGGTKTYRLGAAHSKDGIQWQREDPIFKLDVSQTGWDSEMICYGYPFWHEKDLYCLYNGNSYGLDGVGLAVAEKA